MTQRVKLKTKIIFTILFLLIAACILVGISFSYAWYTGKVENKGNIFKTSLSQVNILTLNSPTMVVGDSEATTIYPKTVSDLFANNNGLISLDDGSGSGGSGSRKFFELDGKAEISNATPNFRMTRPLIVANNTDSPLCYTIDFIVNEVEKAGLSSAMFFNYSRLGGEIPIKELKPESSEGLAKKSTTENLACAIKKIGEDASVKISSGMAHVYMIDFGVLSTAGNSTQGAGIIMDLMLTTSQGNNIIHSIGNEEMLQNAINNNAGGETFILTRDITVNKKIVSDNVFNLDLNGHTMTLGEQAMIEVVFPKKPASMDVGSESGGKIINSSAITFKGVENKSVLNWYTDIADVNTPSGCDKVIVRSHIANANSNSSDAGNESNPSSDITEDKYKGYTDFNSIVGVNYSAGDGTQNSPYEINSLENFSFFVLDKGLNDGDFIKVNTNISKIKNIPADFLNVEINAMFEDGCYISNVVIASDIEKAFFAKVYDANGRKAEYSSYVYGIIYDKN